MYFRPLGQDFRVHFARVFNVEIIYWPESIKLEVNMHWIEFILTVGVKISIFVIDIKVHCMLIPFLALKFVIVDYLQPIFDSTIWF